MCLSPSFSFLLLFFFFVCLFVCFCTTLEFELRASCLLSRPYTTWATPPALLWLFVCLFVLVWFWDRVLGTLCPRLAQTFILLISASWVAWITGMIHQHPASPFFTQWNFPHIQCSVTPNLRVLSSLFPQHFIHYHCFASFLVKVRDLFKDLLKLGTLSSSSLHFPRPSRQSVFHSFNKNSFRNMWQALF
jgi:hypothetical protein